MIYLDEANHNANTALTVGTFDGLHLGHRTLISRLTGKAREIGGRSVLVTFDPHPREVLQGGHNTVCLLTTLQERSGVLKDLGVDEMIVIPFDRDFSLLSSEDFIQKIIFQKIGVKEFIIGYDHQFGKNREGTISTVKKMGDLLGFNVSLVQAHEVEHKTVSSTLIRRTLTDSGDVSLAARYLGRPYMLNGTVIHGDKKGRELGYPTANIKVDNHRKIIPKTGVYAVSVEFEGERYGGMMNIGIRPTVVDSNELRLEVHLFDFDQEIYGKQLVISFIKRVRDEQKFSGLEGLKKQLSDDKQRCIKVLKSVL